MQKTILTMILARGLRGKQIEIKLAEVFNNKK